MKKFFLSLIFPMAAWMGANAMSFNRAQAEALYLTDKMAYELNLNDQQYNDAYEINLDYFLSIDSPSDLYGSYYNYRLSDLRCILHDWQYALLTAADYFLRPIVWRAGGWFFPVYAHYNRGFFYYSHPSVWVSYRGGHGRYYHHAGFYGDRRPVWSGGMRGHDMHRPSPGMGGRVGGRPGVGRPGAGRGYHFDLNGRRGGGSDRGNRSGNYGRNYGDGHNNSSSGNHHSDNRGGNINHGGGNVNHGGSNVNHGGSSSHSNMGRGNSFDGSSSRMGSPSRSSSMGTRSMSPSRGSSSMGSRSMGSSRGGSSMGSHSRGGGSSRSGRR